LADSPEFIDAPGVTDGFCFFVGFKFIGSFSHIMMFLYIAAYHLHSGWRE
jgi:hypothetical protein